MRSLSGILWTITAFRTYAASPEALVYTFPDGAPKESPPSICPNDARLLLAHRLGVSEYHSIGDVEESTLELLNTYGGHSGLLSNDASRSSYPYPPSGPRRLLMFVEGVEHPEDVFNTPSMTPQIKIHDPPSISENYQLILDLIRQDQHRRWDSLCTTNFARPGVFRGDLNSGWNRTDMCGNEYLAYITPDHDEEEYIKLTTALPAYLIGLAGTEHGQTCAIQILTLEVGLFKSTLQIPQLTGKQEARRKQGTAEDVKAAYTDAIDDLKEVLDLISRLQPLITTTVVLMPPSSSYAKKPTSSPYGSYAIPTLPTGPSKLSRRGQPQTEEPLSAIDLPSHTSASSHSSAPETFATSTSPVKGVLPVCHFSKKTAISATHNCSGHGVPYLKYQTKSSNESSVLIDCWACQCSTSVITDDEGKTKTVYWGGPACQKKDISVAFWLLATLGIGLAATTSWGIGLMYSIGEEDLPSVIGAGVAGPRAQK